MGSINLSDIVRALHGRRSGTGWACKCPAHGDKSPSLSVSEGDDGKVLVHCFAGCTQDAVIGELRLMGLWREAPDDAVTRPARRRTKPVRSVAPINWDALSSRYEDAAVGHMEQISGLLGVGVQSLFLVRVGQINFGQHTFPMFHCDGREVGIRVRHVNGRKWAVDGSRNGMFIPTAQPGTRWLLVCEGPTDTAAALTLGFDAIGRPCCGAGVECDGWAMELCRKRDCVVMVDMDPPGSPAAKANGEFLALLKTHARTVRPLRPLVGRDIREWLRSGATHAIVEHAIRNATVMV